MIFAQWEASGLIEKGGPLVWILIAMAFFGSVCIVERFFFFHRARINVSSLLVGLGVHVKRRAFAEALHEAARAPGPVGRVAHAALLRYYLERKDLGYVVREAGQMEVPAIEKNIRFILAVALIAPLIGMLGTMLGMIDAFQRINEQGGPSGPTELSAGVLTALITSVIGLTVAVPMYVFYLYFVGRSKRLVSRIERAGIEIVHMIADAREEEEFAPFQGETRMGRKKSRHEKAPVKVKESMKLETTLDDRPGFLHAVPVFDLIMSVTMLLLLGPMFLSQGGVSVGLPESRFQMERYQDSIVITIGKKVGDEERLYLGRQVVTLDELKDHFAELNADENASRGMVLLKSDVGSSVGMEREISEVVLRAGFKLALVGKRSPLIEPEILAEDEADD